MIFFTEKNFSIDYSLNVLNKNKKLLCRTLEDIIGIEALEKLIHVGYLKLRKSHDDYFDGIQLILLSNKNERIGQVLSVEFIRKRGKSKKQFRSFSSYSTIDNFKSELLEFGNVEDRNVILTTDLLDYISLIEEKILLESDMNKGLIVETGYDEIDLKDSSILFLPNKELPEEYSKKYSEHINSKSVYFSLSSDYESHKKIYDEYDFHDFYVNTMNPERKRLLYSLRKRLEFNNWIVSKRKLLSMTNKELDVAIELIDNLDISNVVFNSFEYTYEVERVNNLFEDDYIVDDIINSFGSINFEEVSYTKNEYQQLVDSKKKLLLKPINEKATIKIKKHYNNAFVKLQKYLSIYEIEIIDS